MVLFPIYGTAYCLCREFRPYAPPIVPSALSPQQLYIPTGDCATLNDCITSKFVFTLLSIMTTSTDKLQAMLNGPALALPNDSAAASQMGNSHLVHVMLSLCMVVAGLSIALRIYTQISVHGKLEMADCRFTS
jgi:hypothetical protein